MGNKSILVMDTPENCYDCILNYDSFCCGINNVNFFDDINFDPVKTRLSSCPLKSLPEKKKYHDGIFNAEVKGWNNCINQIIDK